MRTIALIGHKASGASRPMGRSSGTASAAYSAGSRLCPSTVLWPCICRFAGEQANYETPSLGIHDVCPDVFSSPPTPVDRHHSHWHVSCHGRPQLNSRHHPAVLEQLGRWHPTLRPSASIVPATCHDGLHSTFPHLFDMCSGSCCIESPHPGPFYSAGNPRPQHAQNTPQPGLTCYRNCIIRHKLSIAVHSSCIFLLSVPRYPFVDRRFNSTRGFPGEGHGNEALRIASANVTGWWGGRRALERGDFDHHDIVFIQEHKLAQPKVEQAKTWLKTQGWESSISPSIVTSKRGISAGTAILWRPHLQVTKVVADCPGAKEGRATCIHLRAATVGNMALVSIYGYTGQEHRTLALLEAIADATVGTPYLIMGDLNLPQATTAAWALTQPHRVKILNFGSTCFTAAGASDIDHGIISAIGAHLVKEVGTLDTSLATHRPISVELATHTGNVDVDTIVKKARAPHSKVIGPQLEQEGAWAQWPSRAALPRGPQRRSGQDMLPLPGPRHTSMGGFRQYLEGLV